MFNFKKVVLALHIRATFSDGEGSTNKRGKIRDFAMQSNGLNNKNINYESANGHYEIEDSFYVAVATTTSKWNASS